MNPALPFTCLMALAAIGSPTLLAQDKPEAVAAAKEALPLAESIFDKYIEATGGKEAYKKMKNTVLKGSMDMMGMTMEVTGYKAEPNLMLTEVNIPGMGKALEGFDGKNSWSYNPIQGPSIKQGKESEFAKIAAEFRQEEWKNMYSKIETVGVEMVEGEECYKVAVTAKNGMAGANFYSKKSGLLIRTDAKTITEMGEFEAQITYKDYRKVGDLLLIPFQVVTSIAGMVMPMTYSEIKINVDLPKSTFEPPAEVKALISK
jgi:outer membrane lipoprotein-sorting protein